eukprot:gnl/TRDRNA2_/TRDRNA2_172607_c2_seq19.p1 gnl/TRDRNA2_/TRDRNA2_172607_c2~~gnl/TRDRNA2_/TRDRNA2_172607_c2_seq19.p1  ORF type:complete len:298 (-),score=38.55 gnl/TRDRNA2_/TRDRNA2_172607_c2_seq19:55-948(-)
MGFALRSHPRNSYNLSTKVGRTLEPVADLAKWDSCGWAGGLPFRLHFDYTYDGIRRQHRESLHRLGHGRVEVLVIHDMEEAEKLPASSPPFREQLLKRGGFRALEELRRSGTIRAFGAGLNSAEGREGAAYRRWNRQYMDDLIGAHESGGKTIDFFLMAGIHTLLNHSAVEDGLLETCRQKGIGVVVGGAFNSGILASGVVEGATYDYEPASEAIISKVRALEAVCAQHKVPLAAAALQYPLGHPSVATVIAGAKSPQEVDKAVALMDVEIPTAFWTQLLHDGLLPHGAPIPCFASA